MTKPRPPRPARAARPRVAVRRPQGRKPALQYVDTVIEEGMSISFGPSGEEVRITRVEGDQITVEKLP